MKRAPVTLLLLLALAYVGRTEEPPPGPDAAADAVLEAFDRGETGALEALARRRAPDPWLVADRLLLGDRHDAALAFAQAGHGRTSEALLAHLLHAQAGRDDRSERALLDDATAAFAARHWPEALRLLEAFDEPPDSVVRVRLHHARGRSLLATGRNDDAVAAFVRAGEGAFAMGWYARAAYAFHAAGVTAYRIGRMDIAIEAWARRRQVARTWEHPALLSATLNNLGIAYQVSGRYDDALRSYAESLELARQMDDEEGVADTLGNIGIVHERAGRYAEALDHFERALDLKRDLGDRPGEANTLNNIGLVLQAVGRHEAALERYRASLEIDEQLGNQRGRAETLNNVGIIQQLLGEHREALATYEEALGIAKELADDVGVANTLNNVGLVHEAFGEFEEALDFYRRSIAIKERVPDPGGIARTLLNVANVHHAQGRYDRSLQEHETAIRLAEEVGDRMTASDAVSNLALVWLSLGRLDAAEAAAQRARATAEEAGATLAVASAHGNLGTVALERGDFDAARRHFHAALERSEAAEDAVGTAEALASLGQVAEREGRPTAAHEHYLRALETARAGQELAVASRLLAYLAALELRAGRYDAAEAGFHAARDQAALAPQTATAVLVHWGLASLYLERGRAEDGVQEARDGVAQVVLLGGGLAEDESAGARDAYTEIFDVGLRAAVEAEDPEAVLFFLEQGRAVSLRRAIGTREAIESAVLPDAMRRDLREARERERAALDRMRRRLRPDATETQGAQAREAWLEARDRSLAVVRRIRREARRAAAIALPNPVDLDDLRACLAADEALVLYAPTTTGIVAFVVAPDGARIVSLGSAPIALRRDPASLVLDPDLPTFLGTGLGLTAATRRVFVSPSPRLAHVPMSAVFPGREVVHVPSGTVLVQLRERAEERGHGILAVGGAHPVPTPLSGPLPPLPGSGAEARAVGTETLLGTAATEREVRTRLGAKRRWRGVHFACHAYVDAKRPMLSALALTPEGEDDGHLTVIEVLRTPTRADLVVLAACRSGRGHVHRTEGVLGLARAFLHAGASAVLCSSWDIDDDATRELMTRFYECWSEGTSVAGALRIAQDHIRTLEAEVLDEGASMATGSPVHVRRRPWADPRYWAGWSVWGLPR